MAFYDGILRSIGIPTQKERNEVARDDFADMAKARDPASVFAVRHAQSVAMLTDRELRASMPRITGEIIPPFDAANGEGSQRRTFVARSLKDHAGEFIDRGDDRGMTPVMGQAVREHALSDMHDVDDGMRTGRILDVMTARAVSVGTATRTYLANGEAHERALDTMATQVVDDPVRMSMLRNSTGAVLEPLPAHPNSNRMGWDVDKVDRENAERWAREALAVEVALMRGGTFRPDRVVEHATAGRDNERLLNDAARGAQPGELRDVHPNFAVGSRTRAEDMQKLVDRHITSSIKTFSRDEEINRVRGEQEVARSTAAPGLTPARTAAFGAMQQSMGAQR